MTLNDEDITGSLVIPKWFLYVFSLLAVCFNLMFIPWAGWVTSTLFRIDSTTSGMATLSSKVDAIAEKQARLEGRVARYHGDPHPHADEE